MRKILVLILSIAVLSALLFLQKQGKPTVPGDVLSERIPAGRDLTVGNKTYRVVWAKVNPDELTLIPNFTEKKTSTTVMAENRCSVVVNAGFYSKSSEPIGFFVSGSEEISGFTQNRLFDGVLSVNELGTPRITREVPEDPLVNAVQTGPVVFENGAVTKLSFVRDSASRRVIAAVSGENELIFMVFYTQDSAFSGPLLAELPEGVAKLNVEENLGIADAINLDGGSASAFAIPGFSLTEASPVGSFFCAR
ncbi:hypothetical protein A2803_02905 [Candidatus Woesebacteria bacterium RIFCSPHIGHO2_01_FULL_44_21]|uniref:Phosphodiester glycosidase domain-containing protein n=1 Tax=Candidatus Woesebacteria bacterium RIFCSPHIGHO2_01_FULL_44_21 TaxID=1802503 RepID=A0A1F7Z0F6_9BACT|nr:MAG: hypothetical protein A2803_02905 [Candidatus Woesebacteria bacterium RIFCSPHIGHO2_01_FULL_44_21]OGM69236.1 MAG: hypothetical protein A2897_04475 [Candidatus Woesebacteria bacterium RIFCSPLOWO2_01_FULL_44_24b]